VEEGGQSPSKGDDYGDYIFVHVDAMQAAKVKLEHSSAQANSGGNNKVKRAITEQKKASKESEERLKQLVSIY
jgi:hypothetical protein